jgi:hypothetical protein
MTRAELLEAASSRLTEAALLLVAAGENHLAADAEELAEWGPSLIDPPAIPCFSSSVMAATFQAPHHC